MFYLLNKWLNLINNDLDSFYKEFGFYLINCFSLLEKYYNILEVKIFLYLMSDPGVLITSFNIHKQLFVTYVVSFKNKYIIKKKNCIDTEVFYCTWNY